MNIWIRHEEIRRYAPGQSGPTEIGHWVEHDVASETSRSYVLHGGRKVPKNGTHGPGVAFSTEERDREMWVRAHRHKIADAVGHLGWGVVPLAGDVFDKLKAIAAIVGYQQGAA